MNDEFSNDEQWKFFAEFSAFKIEMGEPTPHLDMIGVLAADASTLEEKIWRIGCYAATYNVAMGEILWSHWPLERVLKEGETLLLPWLVENRSRIKIHTMRRCVRGTPKLAENMLGFANWIPEGLPPLLIDQTADKEFYERCWESITSVKYMGRYIVIRILEAFQRHAGIPANLFDIRAIGGWSPRKMLSLLFPQHEQMLINGGDGKEAVALINDLSNRAISQFKHEHGVELSHFLFATLLCEYRECYESRQRYPGRTHDEQLEQFLALKELWPEHKSQFYQSRDRYPNLVRGELQGWDGIRKELNAVLRDHRYNWSDLYYDYHKTTDLAEPVRRQHATIQN